jgi:HK97 family phage portal protein
MLDLLFGPKKRAYSDGWWPTGRASGRIKTQGGVVVDEDLALTYSAVWCATRVLVEAIGTLPLFTYERQAGDERALATEHPVYEILKTAPNDQMGAMSFREGRAVHQINWGQGFAEIERNARGDVVNLWPIHPGRVRPVRPGDTDTNGRELRNSGMSYLVRNNDGSSIALKPKEMLHIPGALSEDGIWGKGVIAYARESVGMGIATERHGAAFFGSRGQPPAIVFASGLRDKEARQNFRREWKEIHGSPDSGEIAILPIDGKYQHISIPNEDGQFLGTRKFNVTTVAQWYKVPPHTIGDLERATFSNIEHLGIEFVIYSLLHWLRRTEEQINLKLFSRRERGKYFVEHQLAAFLRGDMQSRFAAYQVGLMNGFMTINQICRLENWPTIGPEGDLRFVAVNLAPLHTYLPGAQDPPTPEDDTQDPDAAPTGNDDDEGAGTGAPPTGTGEQEARALPPPREAQIENGKLKIGNFQLPAGLDAAKAVLIDALRRMAVKESKAATKALDQRVDFERWLDDFFGRHVAVLSSALAPALGLLAVLGVVQSGEALARQLCLAAAKELLAAYNTDTKSQMGARLAAWDGQRIEDLAAKIVAGEMPATDGTRTKHGKEAV